jgi:cytosine/adenosine deaminase-related metal-dependent hydrolase
MEGDVLITEGRIAALGPNLTVPPATRLLDASGLFVLPGLVQGHVHLGHRLFRGWIPPEPEPWRAPHLLALEAGHSEETAYWSTLQGAVECLRSGTTTVAEFGLPVASEGVFRAVLDAGIRATVGMPLRDSVGLGHLPGNRVKEALESALDLFRRWNGAARGRIRVSMNPESMETASPALWEQACAAARASKAPLHTHLSGKPGSTAEIDLLAAAGALEPGLIAAHGVHLDGAILDRLGAGTIGLIHCPSSEAKCGFGAADLSRWRGKAVVRLGLGCDGIAGLTGLDLWEELRTAMVLQESAHGPGGWSAREALEAATLGGAGALGLAEELGSLEPGKSGDLVVLDLSGSGGYGLLEDSVYAQVVTGAGRDSVRWVVVDGEVVVEKGFLPHLDPDALLRKPAEAAALLRRALPRTAP